MNSERKSRYIVPAAAAILLTFARGNMLSFQNIYTSFDILMNYFVLIVAPLFAIKEIFSQSSHRNIGRVTPILLLMCWVISCIIFGSPREYWPPVTAFVTLGLSLMLCSQIPRFELHNVRYCILLLSAVFTLYTLIYGQGTLHLILSGRLNERLGAEISPWNVIAYPRIMYMLLITCLVTLFIEKKVWVRISAMAIMIIPALIAFATGGRGPLVGFIVAIFVFIVGISKKLEGAIAGIVVGLLSFISFNVVIRLFPILQQRILEEKDTGRLDIWKEALNSDNLSLFGQGVGPDYPHNIFLEFYMNYGIVGLCLFLVALATSLITAGKCYIKTRDKEVLWVLCLLVLQMTAQQFSLDIFFGPLWAAMVFPLGITLHEYSDDEAIYHRVTA